MINKLLLILLIILLITIITIKCNNLEKFNSQKKIAFCFLIYDKINNEEIWYNYFKNIDKNKYNIYIHYKENKPLTYFEKYKLNKIIKTEWCSESLVKAQNILLKKAMQDVDNQHFIFISNSCIPLKSFNYIYNSLNKNKSYFNKANSLYKMNKFKLYKASQWCILNRTHSNVILNNIIMQNEIFSFLKNKGCPDEYVYLTILFNKNLQNDLVITSNKSADAITFTGWPDMENYKIFEKTKLSKNQPNTYKHICLEELVYLINSNSLFGRKFEDNCSGLENLINQII